jgi:hypothetical protein
MSGMAMFDRRFEWWKGVRRGFGIPSRASTARSAKPEGVSWKVATTQKCNYKTVG